MGRCSLQTDENISHATPQNVQPISGLYSALGFNVIDRGTGNRDDKTRRDYSEDSASRNSQQPSSLDIDFDTVDHRGSGPSSSKPLKAAFRVLGLRVLLKKMMEDHPCMAFPLFRAQHHQPSPPALSNTNDSNAKLNLPKNLRLSSRQWPAQLRNLFGVIRKMSQPCRLAAQGLQQGWDVILCTILALESRAKDLGYAVLAQDASAHWTVAPPGFLKQPSSQP